MGEPYCLTGEKMKPIVSKKKGNENVFKSSIGLLSGVIGGNILTIPLIIDFVFGWESRTYFFQSHAFAVVVTSFLILGILWGIGSYYGGNIMDYAFFVSSIFFFFYLLFISPVIIFFNLNLENYQLLRTSYLQWAMLSSFSWIVFILASAWKLPRYQNIPFSPSLSSIFWLLYSSLVAYSLSFISLADFFISSVIGFMTLLMFGYRERREWFTVVDLLVQHFENSNSQFNLRQIQNISGFRMLYPENVSKLVASLQSLIPSKTFFVKTSGGDSIIAVAKRNRKIDYTSFSETYQKGNLIYALPSPPKMQKPDEKERKTQVLFDIAVMITAVIVLLSLILFFISEYEEEGGKGLLFIGLILGLSILMFLSIINKTILHPETMPSLPRNQLFLGIYERGLLLPTISKRSNKKEVITVFVPYPFIDEISLSGRWKDKKDIPKNTFAFTVVTVDGESFEVSTELIWYILGDEANWEKVYTAYKMLDTVRLLFEKSKASNKLLEVINPEEFT